MKKTLIASLVCLIAGALLFCIPMANNDWEFEKLDTENIQDMSFSTLENENVHAQDVTKVQVKILSTKFALTRGGEDFTLTYYDSDVYKTTVTYEEGVIDIRETGNVWKQIFRLFSGFRRSRLTTTLNIPQDYRGDLVVNCANSDLSLAGETFQSVSFRTNNGKIEVEGLNCTGNAEFRTSNGPVRLTDVSAAQILTSSTNGGAQFKRLRGEKITFDSSNGDIDLEDCSAAELQAGTSNGRVNVTGCETGKLLLKSSNGRIDIGNTQADVLEARTSNGPITAALLGNYADYAVDCRTSNGSAPQNQQGNGSGRSVTLRSSNGNIVLTIAPLA